MNQRTPRQLHASLYMGLDNSLLSHIAELTAPNGNVKIGRDAKTGRFIPVKEAQRRKGTAVVQSLKKK